MASLYAGGTYTGNFVVSTPGLELRARPGAAAIVSADTPNEQGLNVALTIAAPGVSVTGIDISLDSIDGAPEYRDIGVFVTPTSGNVRLRGVSISRAKDRSFEPSSGPGSRGLLAFDAAGITLESSTVSGPWEDGVHLPARDTKARPLPKVASLCNGKGATMPIDRSLPCSQLPMLVSFTESDARDGWCYRYMPP